MFAFRKSSDKKPLRKDPLEGIGLSEHELRIHLGIGNPVPAAMTYPAWKGWNGNAIYHFVKADHITPFLTGIRQMNNWNYVLFSIPRIAVERGRVEEPVDPVIKRAVDVRTEKTN